MHSLHGQDTSNSDLDRVRHVLSTRTTIPPDIPDTLVPLLGTLLADIRARNTLVVPVVPLSYILGDLDPSGALGEALAGGGLLAVGGPGELGGWDAEVEELEGALGAFAGGDVAGGLLVSAGYWM